MKRLCLLMIVLSTMLYSTKLHAAETVQADGAVIPAKADFADLRLTDKVLVKRVIDPLRLELADGRIVQLSGIDSPDLDAHEPGDIAVAATTFLKGLLEGKQARLYITKDPHNGRVNRMGYQLAHVEREDGDLWVQGVLLANGLARVYPSARNVEMAAQMLTLEDVARARGLGLWADKKFAILSPETAARAMHSMAVVEGTIKTASTYDNRVFLNFGDDWRSDFTIEIAPVLRRKLNRNDIDPLSLAHRRVRVHGWIEDSNGPSIDLADPAWLEFVPQNVQ